ncbi:PfkB family carbohydrate kinase [Massilia terrae]
MNDVSKKERLLDLVRANPFISQQELADQLGLSRSAVAGHIAALIRERRLLGRAYVLPERRAIVCIGAAALDRKLRSPARLVPGTSNPATQSESFGGVARNVAENLARLGAAVGLVTALGQDAAGAALLAHADGAGIDTRGVLHLADAVTGTYTAVLDADGEMTVALADMALYDRITPDLIATRRPQRANAAMVVADLNLPQDTLAQVLADAALDAVPLVLVAASEPKMARLPARLDGAMLMILNAGELGTRVGRPLPGDADIAAACAEVQGQGVRDLVITRGAAGVLFTSPDGIKHLPAPKAEVVDVTGAGDAFAAAVCWSLQQDPGDLELACRRGLCLSALTLGSPHTVCPTLPDELFAGLHQQD